jgi:hypothetical protein
MLGERKQEYLIDLHGFAWYLTPKIDETIARGLVKGSGGMTQKSRIATKPESSNIKLTSEKVEASGKQKKKCC